MQPLQRLMRRPIPNVDAVTALRMTRPGFGVITLTGCWLGFALAHHSGFDVSLGPAFGVVLVALLLHAAANVLNDYHDARSGADDANEQGIFPFTGGSRLIQNGVVTLEQTRGLAGFLLGLAVPIGLWLAWQGTWILVGLGLAGLLLGWVYSAPPVALMRRGAGEVAVGLAWALLVIGADAMFRGTLDADVAWLAAGYGALIANILLINGFPDASADAMVGKRTAVVRLGRSRAVWLYAALLVMSQCLLWRAMGQGVLPVAAGWALLSGLAGGDAWRLLRRHADAPQILRAAIVRTIVAALLYGGGIALGCM